MVQEMVIMVLRLQQAMAVLVDRAVAGRLLELVERELLVRAKMVVGV